MTPEKGFYLKLTAKEQKRISTRAKLTAKAKRKNFILRVRIVNYEERF